MVPHRRNEAVSSGTLTLVILVITVVWAVNFTAAIFLDRWEGSTGVNAVMMAAVGLLGAAKYRQQGQASPPPPLSPSSQQGEVRDDG